MELFRMRVNLKRGKSDCVSNTEYKTHLKLVKWIRIRLSIKRRESQYELQLSNIRNSRQAEDFTNVSFFTGKKRKLFFIPFHFFPCDWQVSLIFSLNISSGHRRKLQKKVEKHLFFFILVGRSLFCSFPSSELFNSHHKNTFYHRKVTHCWWFLNVLRTGFNVTLLYIYLSILIFLVRCVSSFKQQIFVFLLMKTSIICHLFQCVSV